MLHHAEILRNISNTLSVSKTTNVATLKQPPFLLLLISMSQRKCGTSDILGICNIFSSSLSSRYSAARANGKKPAISNPRYAITSCYTKIFRVHIAFRNIYVWPFKRLVRLDITCDRFDVYLQHVNI